MGSQNSKFFNPWMMTLIVTFFAAFVFGSLAQAQVTRVSSSLSSTSLQVGQTLTSKVTLKSRQSLSGLIVDIRILDANNTVIARKAHQNVSIKSRYSKSFQSSYVIPSHLAAGRYSVIVGAWSSNWSTTYIYEQIGAFSVVAPVVVAPPVVVVPTAPATTELKVSLLSKSISKTQIIAGEVISGRVSIGSATYLQNVLVDLRVVDSANQIIARKAFENQVFSAGGSLPYQFDFQSAASLATGQYRMQLGVFSYLWDTYLYDDVGAFAVQAAVVVAPAPVPVPAPTPAPVPTTPSAPALNAILVDDGNLLANPGFENNLAGWNSWGDARIVTNPIRSGSRALQLGGLDTFNIRHRVKEGTTYRFTAHARLGSSGEGYVGVSMRNSANVEVFNRLVAVTSTSYSAYSIDFTVGANVEDVRILFFQQTAGTNLFVDDVSLLAISPVATMVYAQPSAVPAGGLGYPYGSHRGNYIAGIRPQVSQSSQDEAIKPMYDRWKRFALRTQCGNYHVAFSPNRPFITVSEGQSYGMMITVAMAGYDPQAREIFDGLFRFARAHASVYSADLMDWAINNDCTNGGGAHAVDGDLDIALALLMADKQWGSTGSINYLAEALKTIKAIKLHNTHTDGRILSGNAADLSRISDYMIGHFRAFKKATQDPHWDVVINKSYELMNYMQATYAPQTGLLPGWIQGLPGNPNPSPGGRIESSLEGDYDWNSNRIPMRLATDYVFSGDNRSRVITQKIMNFMQSSSGGVPQELDGGYKLDGTSLTNHWVSMSFVGPNTAGAMVDGSFQTFLNSLWNFSSTYQIDGYYDNELTLMSLLVVSGNWFTP